VLTRLDHLVVLVRDLDAAVRDYARLGFAVTPGGEHADGLTRNALIPFEDGTYLELVTFVDPEDPRDNIWGWRPFLSSGGGLIDYCVASDDLEADVRRLGGAGFVVDGPADGGRRLPDGTRIRWRVARILQEGRLLPFLIEDLTPRSSRVPGGALAEHPNGATGIARLELVAADAEKATMNLSALVGVRRDPDAAGSTRLSLGGSVLRVIPGRAGSARRRLASAGPGPLAVELAGGTVAADTGKLDERLSHGVDLKISGRDVGA
jgi:catechol 2,3-dioxygenase-like lactoylglutathione lyase family enzyme